MSDKLLLENIKKLNFLKKLLTSTRLNDDTETIIEKANLDVNSEFLKYKTENNITEPMLIPFLELMDNGQMIIILVDAV